MPVLPSTDDRYFAYGSNMDPDQMAHRGLAWSTAEGAALAGYRLEFDFDARSRWLGGAADILRDAGGTVEGVLYHLADDISVMDEWEGGYRRVQVGVSLLADGTGREAWTYEVVRKGDRMTPSEVYAGQMLKGARDFGLSDGYVRELEGFVERGREELGDHVIVLRAMARAISPMDPREVAGRTAIPPGRAEGIVADLVEWGWLEPAGEGGGHVVPPDRTHRAPWVLR
jgi:hypothetical protein